MAIDDVRAVGAAQPVGAVGAAALLGVTAVAAMAYGAVFVLLAELQDRYGFPDWGLGLISASAFLLSFVAQVSFSSWADRGHARRLLWLGLTLSAGGMLLFAVGGSLGVLVAGRALQGLGTGLLAPATRRVLVAGRRGTEGRVLGRLEAMQLSGFLAGPPVAAVIAGRFGVRAPFLVLGLAIAACAPALALVAEPRVESDQRRPRAKRLAFDLLDHRGVLAGLAIGAGLYTTIGVFDAIWARFLTDLGASTGFVAWSLLLFGLPMVITLPIGGRLVDRYGALRLGVGALAFGPVFLVAYGLVGAPGALAGIALLHALVDSVTTPAGTTAVARAAPPGRAAAAQGLYGAVNSLAAGLTGLTAPALYGAFGPGPMWSATAAAVALLVGLALWSSRSRPGSRITQ